MGLIPAKVAPGDFDRIPDYIIEINGSLIPETHKLHVTIVMSCKLTKYEDVLFKNRIGTEHKAYACALFDPSHHK
jgi:hypothetical protein